MRYRSRNWSAVSSSLVGGSELVTHRLAILGAGVMGETVISGLLRAGWSADDVVATDRRPDRQVELVQRYGITMLDNAEAAATATQ